MYYTYLHIIADMDPNKTYVLPAAYIFLHLAAIVIGGGLNCNLTVKEFNNAVEIASDVVFVDNTGTAIIDRIPKGTHFTIKTDKQRTINFYFRARI